MSANIVKALNAAIKAVKEMPATPAFNPNPIREALKLAGLDEKEIGQSVDFAAKKHAEASGESLKGNVNSVLGQLTGDHGKHAAGETQKAHAEAQHRAA